MHFHLLLCLTISNYTLSPIVLWFHLFSPRLSIKCRKPIFGLSHRVTGKQALESLTSESECQNYWSATLLPKVDFFTVMEGEES